MTLKIAQEAEYIGDGRWKWAVWIDGTPAELAAVDTVAWQLHPTFPEPLRWTSDAATRFRLEAIGWGTFTVAATLYNEKGQPAGPLYHELEFPSAGGQEAGQKGADHKEQREKRVYIAGSIREGAVIESLRKNLLARGVDVDTALDDARPGTDWQEAMQSTIRHADAVVVVLRGPGAPYAQQEVELVRSGAKLVIPVMIGEAELPAAMQSFQALHIDNGEELDAPAIDGIVAQLDR
jgi:hypothetical protein